MNRNEPARTGAKPHKTAQNLETVRAWQAPMRQEVTTQSQNRVCRRDTQ